MSLADDFAQRAVNRRKELAMLGMPVPLADEAMAAELAAAHQRIADLTAEVAKLRAALDIERGQHGAALKTLSDIEQAIRDLREGRRA